MILWIFTFLCDVGELERCLVLKFQLCTMFGSRKNANKLKRKNSGFLLNATLWTFIFNARSPKMVLTQKWYVLDQIERFSTDFGTFFGRFRTSEFFGEVSARLWVAAPPRRRARDGHDAERGGEGEGGSARRDPPPQPTRSSSSSKMSKPAGETQYKQPKQPNA